MLLSSAITRALPLQRSIGGVQQRRGEDLLASGATGVPSFAVVRSHNYDDFYTEEVGAENVLCALVEQPQGAAAGGGGGGGGSGEEAVAGEGEGAGAVGSSGGGSGGGGGAGGGGGGSGGGKLPTITPRDTARFLVSALTDTDVRDVAVEIWAGEPPPKPEAEGEQ